MGSAGGPWEKPPSSGWAVMIMFLRYCVVGVGGQEGGRGELRKKRHENYSLEGRNVQHMSVYTPRK